MNNIIISVKKFFTNKNTVTILGVIVIILIIYFGYNSQIKKATNPIQVPVASKTIQPRTLITDDMVKLTSIPSVSVSTNVIRIKANVVGKYTAVNTVIPSGSMFYQEAIVSQKPDAVLETVKDGEVLYNFPVTMASTYGNLILPNSYVDIYMKAVDGTNGLMVGKLLENVKVLAVKDSSGNDVFEDTSTTRTPAYIYFGVTEDINILLRKAQYMTSNSVVLFPVPHGTIVSDEELVTEVSTQYLRDFINANTVVIDTTTTDNTANVNDTTTNGEQ